MREKKKESKKERKKERQKERKERERVCESELVCVCLRKREKETDEHKKECQSFIMLDNQKQTKGVNVKKPLEMQRFFQLFIFAATNFEISNLSDYDR